MERYLARIATLLVEPVSATTVAKVFVAKPSLEKELNVGKLFGFAELGANNPEASALLDQLVEEVKDEMYQTGGLRRPPLAPAAADPATATFDEHFGYVLQQANGAVATFLETHQTSADLQQSSILLGNARQQQLVLTAIGRVTGYLFHYRPANDYQAITITEPTPGATVNPLRLFTQTIAGSLGPLDTAFFCTDGVLDYLSLHTIKTAVTGDGGATDTVRQLKHRLQRARPKTAAAAIIISLVLQRQTPPPISLKNYDYAAAAARDSMRTLSNTQRQTSRVLTPRLLPDPRQLWHWLQATSRRYRQRVAAHGAAKPVAELRASVTRGSWSRLRLAFTTLRRAAAAAAHSIRRAFSHPVVKTTTALVRQVTGGIWGRYRKLSWRQQLAAAGSLALAALFIYNLATLTSRRAMTARERAFTSVVTQVERLRDAALAALIYQDEAGARARLNEGLRLLDQLPQAYTFDPTVVRRRRELNGKLNELRHEVVIADPLQLANFNNLDDNARTAPLMLRLAERLYAQNARTKVFFTLNLGNRAIAEVQPSTALSGTLVAAATIGRTSAMLLDGDGRSVRLDGVDLVRPIPLTLPGGSAVALASYRDRLYLLSTVAGTIFRADPASGGFTTPRNWIADPSVDLRAAVDLALDGDVYVLHGDGSIIRLRQGRIAPFTLQPVDPPLAGPTKIKTAEGSAFVYVLDPPTKRIVVIGKDGALARQYRSAAFDELRDIVADESRKTIYVLNGARIFGVPMEHVK